jgi:hypothetical protein
VEVDFSELPLYGALGSSLLASNALATPKIRHMGDVPGSGTCYRGCVVQQGGALRSTALRAMEVELFETLENNLRSDAADDGAGH